MRGKLGDFAFEIFHVRITPAGAGKTAAAYRGHCQRQDHPRRCGENSACSRSNMSEMGSPPQVRGKLCRHYNFGFCARITPAGAGKTCARWGCCRLQWDHPRRCGENFYSVGLAAYDTGSPPQVRGKHETELARHDRHGITPAGAGKTSSRAAAHPLARDHPRRCGENKVATPYKFCRAGSPPQVRGKREDLPELGFNLRITPAGAGKTPHLSAVHHAT